jgi:hypothetical protein
MIEECEISYSDCDCNERIYCSLTKANSDYGHNSCGYEVVDGKAYAVWAGGFNGGRRAMFNPWHHYDDPDWTRPDSYVNVQRDKRNGVWRCTFAKDKQAIWDRHYDAKNKDSDVRVSVTFNDAPKYSKVATAV